MMNFRNPVFNAYGTIGCEVEHPVYGWVPMTVTPTDPETAAIHAAALAEGPGPYVPPAVVPANLNHSQWSFLLDLTGFRTVVDTALAALPKGTAEELALWAGMKAVAYESSEFTQHVTLILAAQIRAMGIPGLSIPTDAEITAAWPTAEAFQGAASLGVV